MSEQKDPDHEGRKPATKYDLLLAMQSIDVTLMLIERVALDVLNDDKEGLKEAIRLLNGFSQLNRKNVELLKSEIGFTLGDLLKNAKRSNPD